MLAAVDPFDPNNWVPDTHEYRIYGDDREGIYAVVDKVDYEWAIKRRWRPKKSGNNSSKVYLCCNMHEGTRASRTQHNVFLHVAIMKGSGKRRPSPLHTDVDHKDKDGFNCRRKNLRWRTVKKNRSHR